MPSATDQLTGITNLLSSANSIFGGDKTITQNTSGGSSRTVSGLDISDEGIQRIIDQMMSGAGGVKDISGAARGAGLYNASTEAMLRNDLATRVAGEAAKQSAKTVSETVTSPQVVTSSIDTGGISPLTGLLGIGGLKLAGNLVDKSGGLSGIQAALGLGGSSASSLPANLTNSFDVSLANPLAGSASTVAGSVSDIPAALGNMPFTSYLGPIASLAGGILGGKKALENPLSLGMSSLGTGLALAPALGPLAPLGFLAGPALSGLGSLFHGGSVICTALKNRGLLDPVEYALGEEYLRSLSAYTITGYYIWGLRVADAISHGNPWAIKLTLPWARSRMHLLASHKGWTKYFRYPLGTVTLVIGQPLCWTLGLVLSFVGVSYAS